MSMWEPRSSHLYVCTGLRVCEWFCVGVGTMCLCPCCGQSGSGCACQRVPQRVCVFHAHDLWTCPFTPFNVCLCQRVSKVRGPVRCCSRVRPVSGHVLVISIGCPPVAVVHICVGLSEGACGYMRVPLTVMAVCP